MQPPQLLPKELSSGKKTVVWLAGAIAGLVVIGLGFAGCNLLLENSSSPSYFFLPSFVFLPMAGGLVSALLWKRLDLSIRNVLGSTFWQCVLAILFAAFFLHEGVICLIIVMPIIWVMLTAGALLGRLIVTKPPSKLFLFPLPILILAFIGENPVNTNRSRTVSDEVVIRAPPSKVWPEVLSFPEIPTKPKFWLFRIGLPYPVSTTAQGNFINASRECIFSGNAIFKERVVEFIPEQNLTFDIKESPPDPELLGHLTSERGQFLLRANPDGTTTLVGTTWYSLHVRPAWYFDFWTHHIFRAVHLRVMEDIKRRAES